jgi:hypothetical protein
VSRQNPTLNIPSYKPTPPKEKPNFKITVFQCTLSPFLKSTQFFQTPLKPPPSSPNIQNNPHAESLQKTKLKYNKTKRDITLAISHPKLQLKSPRRKRISLGGCNK